METFRIPLHLNYIMMNRLTTIIGLVISVMTAVSVISASEVTDIEKIKSNYRAIMVHENLDTDSLTADLIKIEPEKEMSDQVVIELHQRYPFDLDKIRNYLSCLRSDGAWNDINYEDTKRSGWEPKQHADRVLEMVKLYKTPGQEFYHSLKLKEMVHRALSYWFIAKPKCLNWWQNEIGIPKTLGAACILIEDELSEEERRGIEEVMSAAKIKMTGQNKVWLAGNVLIRGLLQYKPDLVKMARDTIMSEICVGRAEGIKSDWSFHQHGPQQQFGNYGLAYLSSMVFYNKLFDGTDYRFDIEHKQILESFINEGYKWVMWNRHMDVSALGRQLFHNAQLHKGYALAFSAADFGIDGFPLRGNLLVGHKHFDESDYTIHRTARWMASLKMSSSRVTGTEVVNEDNLLGYYLGDGATYYYVRGDEYKDVFPFWDWRKIPGVTAYEDTALIPNIRKNKSKNRSHLVGGITYGDMGISAMTLDRDGLSAHKAWIFTDDYVACLGGGISSDSLLRVTTGVDARIKRDKFMYFENNEWRALDGHGKFDVGIHKFHHDDTGYVIIASDELYIYAGEKSGSWSDFMKMYRPDTITGDVVTLHINHGINPKDKSYLYFILPACDRETVAQFDVSRAVSVLRNDSTAQVVKVYSSSSPTLWVISYNGEEIELGRKSFIPGTPGIYLIEDKDGKLISKVYTHFKI